MEYRNYRDLTSEELDELERLYPTTLNRELCRRYSISLEGLVDGIATPNGWKKQKVKPYWSCKKIELTEKQLKWFINHYKHTRNADIMAKLHIGESTLHRYARKYGLKKSAQFMNKSVKQNMQMAHDVCVRHGIYEETAERMRMEMRQMYERGERIPGSFAKGVSNKMRLTPKRYKEWRRKNAESIREVRRKEKMRINWGLPQRTKLKFGHNKRKASHRYLFKKFNYIVDRGSDIIYYDELTERRPLMEKRAHLYWLTIIEADMEDAV